MKIRLNFFKFGLTETRNCPPLPNYPPTSYPPLPSPRALLHSFCTPSPRHRHSISTASPPLPPGSSLILPTFPSTIYQCEICGNTFPHESSLMKHKATHRTALLILDNADQPSDDPGLQTCGICGKIFSKDPDLFSHIHIHNNPCIHRHRGPIWRWSCRWPRSPQRRWVVYL